MKKKTTKDCFILFWTALKYVITIAPILLTCSFLAAVSICEFFVNNFKQMVRRMLFVISIHDGIKLGGEKRFQLSKLLAPLLQRQPHRFRFSSEYQHYRTKVWVYSFIQAIMNTWYRQKWCQAVSLIGSRLSHFPLRFSAWWKTKLLGESEVYGELI